MTRKRDRWTITVRTDLPPHPLDAEIMRAARELFRLTRERGEYFKAWGRGKPLAPETRQKIAETMRGRPKSPSACARMAEATKGKRLSPAHRASISRALRAAYAEGRR